MKVGKVSFGSRSQMISNIDLLIKISDLEEQIEEIKKELEDVKNNRFRTLEM